MDKIEALRKGKVEDIKSALPNLTDAELAALRATEADERNPRSTVLALIDAEASARTNNGEGEGGKGGSAAADSAAAAPAWQVQDYTGPLTIDQAEWRRARFAVAPEPVTK